MKQAFLALATMLLFVIPTPNAFSQSTTTISYDATVTRSLGAHADAFAVGDQVVISYSLDASVPDFAPNDPQSGYFPDAVRSLSVSFPRVGVSVVTSAAGSAWTYNNAVVPSGQWLDQFTLLGGPISSASLLGGEAIDYFPQVDFLTDFLLPPNEPAMLSSDALPVFKLSASVVQVHLRTASGFTHVYLQLNASTTRREQIEALITLVDDLVAAGRFPPNFSYVMNNSLQIVLRAVNDPDATTRACLALRNFQHLVQIISDPRRGWLAAEDGVALIEAAESISSNLGCQ